MYAILSREGNKAIKLGIFNDANKRKIFDYFKKLNNPESFFIFTQDKKEIPFFEFFNIEAEEDKKHE